MEGEKERARELESQREGAGERDLEGRGKRVGGRK
jgi:hypothetical protein